MPGWRYLFRSFGMAALGLDAGVQKALWKGREYYLLASKIGRFCRVRVRLRRVMNAIFEITVKWMSPELTPQETNEMILSLPDVRRSADPMTAGGQTQLPVRSDSATPTGAAKPAVPLHGVVRSGRGHANEHLPTAPAPPQFTARVRIERSLPQRGKTLGSFPIELRVATNFYLSRRQWAKKH